MRNRAPDVLPADQDVLLTTGEAAKLLNSSRQHVVDLAERGDLPFTTVGTHRRVRRSDVEMLRTRTQRMSRDQERSLWLAFAVAGRIVENPDKAVHLARHNLETMRQVARGHGAKWLDEWEKLLDGPITDLVVAYTSRNPRGRELRQNAPFAGLLRDSERAATLDAWAQARTRR